ncbi:MAG TPA: hypothetical protein VHG89_03840, partial [Verrucomicrobiae bacterium]|nr:hypothetical protein [Verrucomicrobiae bacterium]
MKNTPSKMMYHGLALAALLWNGANQAFAASDFTENTYDDSTSVNGDWAWWGVGTFAWTNVDHTGNGGGSLYLNAAYVNPGAGNNQISIGESFSHSGSYNSGVTIDATEYTNVSLWMKWDTNSTVDFNSWQSSGDNGLQLQFTGATVGGGSGWGQIGLGALTLPSTAVNGDWVHINVPINPATQYLDGMQGWNFKKYNPDSQTGTVGLFIDDIVIQSAGGPPPPPTLSFQKPVTGLNINVPSGPYNRESLESVNAESWVGHGGTPVTYSFTVKQGVDGSTGASFQNHIFIAPNPGTETSPDWNEANCIFADLEATADGGAQWLFRYKTNNPNANDMIYNNGALSGVTITSGGSGYTSAPTVSFVGGGGSGVAATAQIDPVAGTVTNVTIVTNGTGYTSAPTVVFDNDGTGGSGAVATAAIPASGLGTLAFVTDTNRNGTWSLTFVNDTNITLTSPSGNTTNFSIGEGAAQLFGDPAKVYFGAQAGNALGVGQKSILSEIKVTGTANPIDDVFANDSGVDTNTWTVNAVDSQGIVLVPSTAVYWLTWTVPDTGFTLVDRSDLGSSGNWSDVAGVTPFQLGTQKYALLNRVNLPSQNTGFFALVKRSFSQLQVLLPGETNAPNTPTGKIGTPDPVSIGDDSGLVTVTINA